MDPCEVLREALSDPLWAETGWSRLDEVAAMTGVEDCIAAGLRRSLDAQDWLMFERYVLAAYHHPSTAYTATLCDALRRRTDELNNDDVVTALYTSRDPEAVECLRETLSWEPPWDDYRWLARKAIDALEAIGTPEALAVVRAAVADPSEEIREAAASALERSDPTS